MAQKTQIMLIDDIDGSDADETVTLGLDGVAYEIDLTTRRAALATYIDAGRKTARASRKRGTSVRAPREHDPAAGREWATANGHCAPTRSRILVRLLEQYRAAN
ncbi:MAG: Lsr2 family protein [Cellulomonadaceae bacterium]|nr:Lsr2 family protein [Cellulomonadaceae bacterium]